MEGFDHILNWTLKRGSHQFPGPDGGTCINEAALVAAGFEYRPIASVRQMPRCFSRPICYLALWLNDNAEDTERQLLLPFVTRLACADTWEIEKEREAYIRSHMPKGALTVQKGIDILEGALAIGRQADHLAPEVLRTRMDAAKHGMQTSAPQPDRPLFGKVKAWVSKVLEPAD
jgi:hypothetical protein